MTNKPQTLLERVNAALEKDHVACFRAIFGEKIKFHTPAATGWVCPWDENAFLVVAPSGRTYQSDGVTTIPVGDLVDARCRALGQTRNEASEQVILRNLAAEVGA